jgi:hypothetical protein
MPAPTPYIVSTRSVGSLLTEARQLLNDTTPISGLPRFTDAALVTTLNEGMLQIRSKRPDAFLFFGLRNPMPIYQMPADTGTVLPFDDQFYSPLLFYVVGRSELVEDTFSDSGRAITLMNKFVSMLMSATA